MVRNRDESVCHVPPLGLVALFVATVALWFPYTGSVYWQSDDFFALHYASDLDRVLDDFIGPQYGLNDVAFYRPLITLSFWLDGALGGANPFVAHLSNAIAHGMSAVLVALIAARFVTTIAAAAGAFAWAAAPAHAGSILWAVGRVDSHTTVWILLAAWAGLRWVEFGRGMRILCCVATALALGSKESALVVPGIVALLAFARSTAPTNAERAATAWSAAWPALLVLVGYAGLRFAALGQFGGGYDSPLALWPAIVGLASSAAHWWNPLEFAQLVDGDLPSVARWAGYLPICLAILLALARRRFGTLAACALLYLGSCVPLYQLLAHPDTVLNQRYLYLPSVALIGLLACGGALPSLLALVVFALPFFGIRADYRAQAVESQMMHAQLLATTADFGPNSPPIFIAGLPVDNAKHTTLAFYLGVDRLTRPPFSEQGKRPVYALRPLSRTPETYRLPDGDESGVPIGTTLRFDGPEILARLPRRKTTPLAIDIEGSLSFDNRRLHAIAQRTAESTRLSFPNRQQGDLYRLTMFSACGYLSTILPATDGHIDLTHHLLFARIERDNGIDLWAQGLRGPTDVDLESRFPLLVEAGRLIDTPAGTQFFADAAARDFLWLEYDPGYVRWLTGEVPD